MTDRTQRMLRMLERQPPAVQNEISLRVLSELVAIEAEQPATQQAA